MAGVLAPLSPGFKEDLLGCILDGDLVSCLFVCFCGPITLAQTRTHIDGTECGVIDCCCGASPFAIRQAIRKKNSYAVDKVPDCIAIWCCMPCVIYQNAKESGAAVIPPQENFTRI